MSTLAAFYLSISIIVLAFVLITLPTVLHGEVEKAAKKLLEEKEGKKGK